MGLGPTHYYFGDHTLTQFIYVDHLGYKNGGMMYTVSDYTYDESTNSVMTGSDTAFQWIGTLDDRYIYAIIHLADKANGVPSYCLMTLQRMTAAELATIRGLYAVEYTRTE